ncbi:RES family NAD+ phosphorylase [Hujiaoplasma nucleasis]|uniref:RES family NAD+ phosphorylase n=1 Tax=Hujiaoplasma nucleasis TaxID=2725268 RepID=A0A7L6N649_9MOLU|nr:RES family NAD+ phosphorylase [Hujiaoplasma nucleasis]QLY40728.1 RES family NAD+ phosphorylase [Hujiaoplasma nucleasis]
MVDYEKRRYAILKEYFKNKNRYIYEKHIVSILDDLKEMFDKHSVVMEQGTILYRSQIGSEWVEENGNGQLLPYNKARMYPRKRLAREGRANPKGIPYLYLASDTETSLNEVRAWPGQEVSTCTFTSEKELRLVDLSKKRESGLASMVINIKKGKIMSKDSNDNLLGEINQAFTTPVRNSDDSSDYVVTQIISELIKTEGYDGIVYNSYFTKSGKNIVIFDSSNMIIKNGLVFRINAFNIEYEQISNAVRYKN